MCSWRGPVPRTTLGRVAEKRVCAQPRGKRTSARACAKRDVQLHRQSSFVQILKSMCMFKAG